MRREHLGKILFCFLLSVSILPVNLSFSETCIQWEPVAPLLQKNFDFGTAVLDGKIYVVGGHRTYGNYLSEVEVYDSSLDQWSWVPSMHQQRSYPGVVSYNGEVWAINGNCCGGPRINSIEIYNREENKWFWSTERGIPFLGVDSTNRNEVVTLGGKVYVVGGENLDDRVLVWDGIGPNWQEVARLPLPLTGGHSVTVANGKIYTSGGGYLEDTNRTFVYDPNLNTWDEGPPINIKRHWHTMVTIGNKVVIAGGRSCVGYNCTYLDSVEILDLSEVNPTWRISECSKLNSPRFWHGSAVINGEIYIIGGKPDDVFYSEFAIVEKGTLLNEAPVALCKDKTVTAGSSCTATASIDNGSYDPDGDPITLSQSPAEPYGLGGTLVTLTVTDSEGASSQCTGTVTVVDQTSPTITVASVNPPTLWPPNHKMVPVMVTASASDNCGTATCKITSVTSNEPENGLGDGDTAPDWQITGNLTVNLRAERSGIGNGRTYTIAITCTDTTGNPSVRNVTVTVPKDQGKK